MGSHDAWRTHAHALEAVEWVRRGVRSRGRGDPPHLDGSGRDHRRATITCLNRTVAEQCVDPRDRLGRLRHAGAHRRCVHRGQGERRPGCFHFSLRTAYHRRDQTIPSRAGDPCPDLMKPARAWPAPVRWRMWRSTCNSDSADLGVILSSRYLSPLQGSTVLVPVSPGSLSLACDYSRAPQSGALRTNSLKSHRLFNPTPSVAELTRGYYPPPLPGRVKSSRQCPGGAGENSRDLGERVNESFGSNVPAFQASILFVVCNHALTRVAIPCRRFAPRFFAHSVEAQGCQSLPDQPRRGGSA